MNAPETTLRTVVPPEWIDINGHMNSTHYGLIVYDAHVMLTEMIGMGDAYVREHACSKAVLASHMVYEREAGLGDALELRSWLLAVDHKRLHFFHELFNLSRDCRAATVEQVDVHIDLRQRKSAPMPGWLLASLQARVRLALAQPLPAGVGAAIRPPRNDWLGA